MIGRIGRIRRIALPRAQDGARVRDAAASGDAAYN